MRAAVLLLLLAANPLRARVLLVPSAEYPTVQSGLNNTEANDTVLVALGTYAEALHAPALPFVLKGDVVPDTGDYPRPVIDPTPLQGSDSLASMTVPSGSVPVVEDMYFHNGPAMYPHWHTGGVELHCREAHFRRCIFDSTHDGLYLMAACSLHVENCRFLNVWQSVYTASPGVFVFASDCFYSGEGWAHITCYAGCRLERCRFASNFQGPQCWVAGPISIRDCQFGPNLPGEQPSPYETLQLDLAWGDIVNNVFTGNRLGRGFITLQCSCDGTDGLRIRHNRFTHNTVETSAGGMCIRVYCQTGHAGQCGAEVDSNLFENNVATSVLNCRGLLFDSDADGEATANRFHDLHTDTTELPVLQVPVVWTYHSRLLRLRYNRFDTTGLALFDEHLTADTLEARMNWWGSATGPFHAETNPDGHGDTIQGRINFSPWCADTSCLQAAGAKDPFTLRPLSFRLSAFPNPFNSTTVIRLEVPQADIVRIELFDILGRKVRELWAGVVADEKEITVDGSTMASGVYFIRATDTIWNRPLVSTKIVLLK